MDPLFIYRSGYGFLVRSLDGQHDPPPDDYTLVATIDPRVWLQSYLNYEAKDRERMLGELEEHSDRIPRNNKQEVG